MLSHSINRKWYWYPVVANTLLIYYDLSLQGQKDYWRQQGISAYPSLGHGVTAEGSICTEHGGRGAGRQAASWRNLLTPHPHPSILSSNDIVTQEVPAGLQRQKDDGAMSYHTETQTFVLKKLNRTHVRQIRGLSSWYKTHTKFIMSKMIVCSSSVKLQKLFNTVWQGLYFGNCITKCYE